MKIGGQIPWNVTAICEKYKISCLMAECSFNGPVIPFGAMVE